MRPTTDKAKEGLFNILQNRINFTELEVLDLFCGTGNISFEFQSRGVRHTHSVDVSSKCIAFVKETMAKLGCTNADVVRSDVPRFVRNAYRTWDLIFADPPYDLPDHEALTRLILSERLLRPNGMLIMEHPAEIELSHNEEHLETRRYGRVHFSFFASEA